MLALLLTISLYTGPLVVRACYRDEDYDVVSETTEDLKTAYMCVTIVSCDKALLVIKRGSSEYSHFVSKDSRECRR